MSPGRTAPGAPILRFPRVSGDEPTVEGGDQ